MRHLRRLLLTVRPPLLRRCRALLPRLIPSERLLLAWPLPPRRLLPRILLLRLPLLQVAWLLPLRHPLVPIRSRPPPHLAVLRLHLPLRLLVLPLLQPIRSLPRLPSLDQLLEFPWRSTPFISYPKFP